MLTIRPASEKDLSAIRRILDEADLRFPGEKFDHFWVAELDGRVAGTVRLEEHPDFFFLTSLGVAKEHQHQGIATALLTNQLTNKPTYLYTIIPDFFQKSGFRIVPQPPANLPSKAPYGCDECFPDQCACMGRYPHAA